MVGLHECGECNKKGWKGIAVEEFCPRKIRKDRFSTGKSDFDANTVLKGKYETPKPR